MKINKSALVGLALSAISLTSHAGVGFVVRNELLIGAVGVDVGGTLYDVTFADGSVKSLGQDTAANPFLESKARADLASQALLDQVFIGAFAVHPAYIGSCVPPADYRNCAMLTYYGGAQESNGETYLYSSGALVIAFADPSKPAIKGVFGQGIPAAYYPNGYDTTGLANFAYALWSPASATPPYNSPIAQIPEPEKLAMMLAGLGMMGAVARRRKAKQA